MAPAGEMAQLVTMMSGQNSLCRDTQQDYTIEENSGAILYLVSLVFFFSIKERKEKKIDKRKPNQK